MRLAPSGRGAFPGSERANQPECTLTWAGKSPFSLRRADAGRLRRLDVSCGSCPVADIAGLSVSEIQALSFHDPMHFRVDPAAIPDDQKTIMAANAVALAVYAGSPAMADTTLLGRLSDITVPTLVLWGESDHIVEPAYGRAYAAAIPGARFEDYRPPIHAPFELPSGCYKGSATRRRDVARKSGYSPPSCPPHRRSSRLLRVVGLESSGTGSFIPLAPADPPRWSRSTKRAGLAFYPVCQA